jgi:arsenite methyltransferase
MNTEAIEKRYNDLANDSCCLSCGGAINYTEPKVCEVCVDIGSGRGTDVLRLAEKVGEKGFVYGLDASDAMIQKAKQNADKLGISNVEWIKTDLESLPLPNESVNLMISNCTINHIWDKQNFWNEAYRILKYGGRFVVSDIYALEEVPAIYKNDVNAVAACWAGAVTKAVYLSQLKKAGFESIKILEESTPYVKGEIKVSSLTITAMKQLKITHQCACGCK